jgi:hypothetical protein
MERNPIGFRSISVTNLVLVCPSEEGSLCSKNDYSEGVELSLKL